MAAAQTSAGTKSSGRSMSGARPVSVMNLISAHISVAVFHLPVRRLSDDVQRAVDRDGQARAARVPQKFFRHELGLHVADAKTVGVRQRRVLGYLAHAHDAEAREHRGAGDVMDRDATDQAGQPDHLAGARHVGGPQFLVRIDEVHDRARVIDDVNAPRELTELAGGQAEARCRARSPGSGTTRPPGSPGSP